MRADATGDRSLRVVVGEDEALLREGLTVLLERGGIEVAGSAGDGEELIRKVGAHRPDLVLADIRMPPSHSDEGLRAALAIRAAHPGIAILLLSQHVHRRFAEELLGSGGEQGGVGYLLKQRVADAGSFLGDLRRVAAGGSVLDPEVVATVIAGAPRDPVERLTERQREVLALMAEGLSNAAIATRLVLSEKAVDKHVSKVYETLGLRPSPDDHRRVLAVVRYLDPARRPA